MAHHPPEWTNQPRRRVKAQAKDWTCPTCGKPLKHYWLTCPSDGAERPEQ